MRSGGMLQRYPSVVMLKIMPPSVSVLCKCSHMTARIMEVVYEAQKGEVSSDSKKDFVDLSLPSSVRVFGLIPEAQRP